MNSLTFIISLVALFSISNGFPATLFPDPEFQDFPIPDTVDELDPSTVVQLFIEFEREYNKEYMSPLDQAKARSIFQFNVESIIRLNQQYANTSLRFGINYYTDFSDLEFKEKVANLHVDSVSQDSQIGESAPNLENIPTSFDWRDRENTVGGVSNQGYCGCSWGFTVSAVIQSAFSIQNSKFFIPSEQQLCDCAQGGNSGCSGGSVRDGFEYVKQNGIILEENYQKHIEKHQEMYCVQQKDSIHVSNYKFIQPAKSSEIQKTLISNGPIAVGFKVSNSFRHYKSGIFSLNDCEISDNFIGWHSVTIVGYGTENEQDFWIAKNSWSPSFGEEGFFRISRNVDLCQIESKMPMFVQL
ncbi:hypothetical protein GCK72_013750 [Caenorhabditis remanei]|uniref:Peptidase C1A papain C-terminal domain-containing protein n=1 Tax=Caenorhabditis remanei TaxID=31234 RepID=A0A6A5GRY7_CAERE|nr:hypothetical protein GCK72_013750 [Caenorhabditis remanei]KAF1757295.1 hypothetical protein GCK72_013750 [Caenorhabditis remanei]